MEFRAAARFPAEVAQVDQSAAVLAVAAVEAALSQAQESEALLEVAAAFVEAAVVVVAVEAPPSAQV